MGLSQLLQKTDQEQMAEAGMATGSLVRRASSRWRERFAISLKKLSRFRRVDERFGSAAAFEDSATTMGTSVSVEPCGRAVDSVLTVLRVVSEALKRLNSGKAAAKAPGSATLGW
jgi:hypothetical protein